MTASIIHVSKNLFQLTSVFLAQVDYTTEGKAPGPIFWICWSAFVVLMIAALWKIFSKAGQPGWAAIIPIVNTYFVCKVAGPAGLVGNPDVHPVRQLHHRDHSVHRYSQEFRQTRRLRDRVDFVAGYFLPDSRFRQRAISRRRCSDYGQRSAATATTRATWRAALIIGPRLASVFR